MENSNIASSNWTAIDGTITTVSLDIEYYSEFDYEYNVRTSTKHLVKLNASTILDTRETVDSFRSKKRAVEYYNLSLKTLNNPDYEAQKIVLY